MRELRAAFWLALLALVWAGMVFWVQSLTTAPTLWKTPVVVYKSWCLRFLLDWSFATLLLCQLSPKWIFGLLGVNLWISTAILSFFVNYHRALSWLTISSQAGEGAAVFLVALEDAAPYLAVLIPLSGVIALLFHRLHARVGRQVRLSKVAALVWVLVFLGLHLDHKPLEDLERFDSADGIAHNYGFLITWLAEAHYIKLEGITEDALAQLNKPASGLANLAPVAIGEKLAIVQVESLDDAVRDFKIRGKEVTPRINRFAREGNLLRVQAPKQNGSCDSDFSLLFGAQPSAKMAPYRIPGFPFERSMVTSLHERGFKTSFYHGVNGNFFERRAAFEKMKFDKLVFREEIIKKLQLTNPEWTLSDGEMFRLMGRERGSEEKFFEFSITGTSHTPFHFSLEAFPRRYFPHSSDRDYIYFDTIAYVDDSIGKYVDELPTGTVVLIYGDHWSRVDNRQLGYHSQMIHEFGIVPVLLFRKTENGIKPLFTVDTSLAQSAQLRLIDVTAWLRKSLNIPPASAG